MSPFIEAEIKRNMQKYGTQAQREVNELSKELKRAARYSNRHHFNLRCDKARISPNSLRIKSPTDTKRAHSAAAIVSRIFLRERIEANMEDTRLCIIQHTSYTGVLKGKPRN